ncbi:hypothetical protein AC1031_016789 [Aphanomyces cochlioides]|nr:hypothetical protein AC1031_016789 [Aphanomyces cochlioides]
MAALRAGRKKEIQTLLTQEQNLEIALEYLKAHPEEQHQGITPFAYTRSVHSRRKNAFMKAQISTHKRWFQWFSGWTIPKQIMEKLGDHIVYVKHEHTTWKYKRFCVAGIFLDNENDRITITQTGIALDDRFPFQGGESRTNGCQWIVFQHVTDRLTIVRWSILNFCPVNNKGPLSLRETARNMRCSVSSKDSEGTLIAKIHSASEEVLENLRDQFLRRCS